LYVTESIHGILPDFRAAFVPGTGAGVDSASEGSMTWEETPFFAPIQAQNPGISEGTLVIA
jgi:hypothetical protein